MSFEGLQLETGIQSLELPGQSSTTKEKDSDKTPKLPAQREDSFGSFGTGVTSPDTATESLKKGLPNGKGGFGIGKGGVNPGINPKGKKPQNPVAAAIQNMIMQIIALFARATSNPFINIAIALSAINMCGAARALSEGEAAKSVNQDNKTPFLQFIAQISGLHGLAKNKHEGWKEIAKDVVTTNYRSINGGNG